MEEEKLKKLYLEIMYDITNIDVNSIIDIEVQRALIPDQYLHDKMRGFFEAIYQNKGLKVILDSDGQYKMMEEKIIEHRSYTREKYLCWTRV